MFCCYRLQHCLHSTTRGHCVVTRLMAIYKRLWSPLTSGQSCLELSLYKLSQTDWTCIIKVFRTYCGGLMQNCGINHPAQPAFRLFSFCSMNTRPLGCFQTFLDAIHKFSLTSKMQRGSRLVLENVTIFKSLLPSKVCFCLRNFREGEREYDVRCLL